MLPAGMDDGLSAALGLGGDAEDPPSLVPAGKGFVLGLVLGKASALAACAQ